MIALLAFADEISRIKLFRFVRYLGLKIIVFVIATFFGIWASVKKDTLAEYQNEVQNQINQDSLNNKFQGQLDTLKNIKDTLIILKDSSVVLNDSLRSELSIQHQTNEISRKVLESLEEEDSIRLQNYDKEIKNNIDEVDRIFTTWYINGDISNTPENIEKVHNIILKCIALLEQENSNPVLHANTFIDSIWGNLTSLFLNLNAVYNVDGTPVDMQELSRRMTTNMNGDIRKMHEEWEKHRKTFRNWK